MNGLVEVKKGAGDQIKEKKNKWISRGKKNESVGTNLMKTENEWISMGKNRGWGPT